MNSARMRSLLRKPHALGQNITGSRLVMMKWKPCDNAALSVAERLIVRVRIPWVSSGIFIDPMLRKRELFPSACTGKMQRP